MADGSPGTRAGLLKKNDLTFSVPDKTICDTKKCSGKSIDGDRVKLSFYRELEASDSFEKSETTRGVAETRGELAADSRKTRRSDTGADGDDRKKRCIDRYDSSESSDSGVAVLSPTESSGCSGSDITEPRSPRSPESECSTAEEGASARMPPWATDPAPPPPASRRLAVQPAPVRRSTQPIRRRITEYFNHKMKPQNNLKRDHNNPTQHDDSKKKCLPKNGVTHDLEKYISYLSQTLSPKVLMDVGRQNEAEKKPTNSIPNSALSTNKTAVDMRKIPNAVVNGHDYSIPRDDQRTELNKKNGLIEARYGVESLQNKNLKNGLVNGFADGKKKLIDLKTSDPSANGVNKHATSAPKGKVPIPALPTNTVSRSPIKLAAKPDNMNMNGTVSSTTVTKLDSRMNGVMCGSNNLSLNQVTPKLIPIKKDNGKKVMDLQSNKRTNRKSSACIANSKNLTWSKANNLKQVQLQKQNCVNATQKSSTSNVPCETNTVPKMNIPNGIRQVSMSVNGSLGNLNLPVNNLQNCHQINIPQPCNGTVNSNNLTSFVAVPQNVMLTTLRIPQGSIQTQTINQQNNMSAFNRPNVNVSSPTKLNGQFVFPLMQNINGAVVQIPNLMAKMPNFVLPQNPQLTQRQDHLQNQQTAQILINGTLLKLSNPMPPTFTSVNKTTPISSQTHSGVNKNVSGVQTVGTTMQPKPNYTMNFSHPMIIPQPGFIVTSVPNMNVKETWSYSGCTASSAQTSCSNPLVHHPPPLVAFTNQALHTSSIPIAPVKPPDNPIQGTDPPSSTVKEPETSEITIPKCDIPWLSKTVNNNIVQLESNKNTTRPFSQVSSSLTEKLEELATKQLRQEIKDEEIDEVEREENRIESTTEEIRKVEEVARREETIFTQITVLKDVSSNVHNTVIETNFCSTTSSTTGSESGIGTDKSIDSPSDSQTSKECDDDSSLSLSVSLCSVEVQSQKSPILKQPKTIRFPPKALVKTDSDQRTSSTDTSSTVVICLWENCKMEFEGDPDLLDHLQNCHVETQVGRENYVCLWERCKVRGKPSCSRLWLERHTLSHGGNKPFKCIVEGCERRFSTQTLLERHVNNHFNETSSNTSGTKKSSESGSKLIRRNGKKLRYRRQPWSARMFDFFDAGTMEGLAYRLLRCTRWRLGSSGPLREPPNTNHTITLRATLTATRYNATADRREALVSYYPPKVLEDEWVPEKEVKRIKRVEISELPVQTKVLLYEQFCTSYKKAAPITPVVKKALPSTSQRSLPARSCASSRLLNNLIAKQRKNAEMKQAASSYIPLVYREEEKTDKVEVSGAKKRKMGRRYGGNAFWPCGR